MQMVITLFHEQKPRDEIPSSSAVNNTLSFSNFEDVATV